MKAICNPLNMSHSTIHDCMFDDMPFPSSHRVVHQQIQMNHYQYRSIEGVYRKAVLNTNWDIVYQSPRDTYFNQVPDQNIDYLSPWVKRSLENRRKEGAWAELDLSTFHSKKVSSYQ